MFDAADYKEIVLNWIKIQEKQGYGQFAKIAKFLKVNTVVISQIFRGDRHLNLDHALKLTRYMGLNPIETQYFLTMVQRDKAGSQALKRYMQKELDTLKNEARKISKNVDHKELNNDDKMRFYSDWRYSAIRLAADIGTLNSVDSLSKYLSIESHIVREILDFLVKTGLVKDEEGTLKLGPPVTHVDADSVYVKSHQKNWRIKALSQISKNNERDLFYSGPMVISNEVAEVIRSEAVKFIKEATQIARPSTSEVLTCLNVDWFQVV